MISSHHPRIQVTALEALARYTMALIEMRRTIEELRAR
jgi:hypothetical protein